MILLSTGSLYTYGTQRVFELAAETGFEGVEIIIDRRADTWQADYLARIASQYGLKIGAIHSPFVLDVPGWPSAMGDRHLRAIELAQQLSAEVVVIHLPTRWTYSILMTRRGRIPIPHLWNKNIKEVTWFEQQLPFIQAETQVAIAVEIMPMHKFLRWPINAHLWNSLAEWPRFDHLTLDTTHCGTWGVDPCAVYDRAKGKVSHIHLSNFDGRQHIPPQQGKLDLGKFLRHIASNGYRGHITIEIVPEMMGMTDPVQVKKNLADSLDFCRKHLRK